MYPTASAQKSPYGAAVPVILGIVGGAFAMSAAFAMSTAGRSERLVQIDSPTAVHAVAALNVRAHMAPASQDPALRILAFNAPLSGYEINSPFGMRRMPWEEGGRLHEGVDIAAPVGAPVAATLPGTVTRTGLSTSYGRFIEVRHEDGLMSFYAHLSGTPKGLAAGSPITAGQTVGFVGGTGRSTGSHLHFEIRQDGKPLNPALFIGRSFASVDQLPLKDAARISSRVRIAVVSNWPASIRTAALNTKAGSIKVASADDGRVHAVINGGEVHPMEIVARDPKKAAEARARLRAMEEADAEAPVATQAPKIKAAPLTVPAV